MHLNIMPTLSLQNIKPNDKRIYKNNLCNDKLVYILKEQGGYFYLNLKCFEIKTRLSR